MDHVRNVSAEVSTQLEAAREVVGHFEHIVFPIILLEICLDSMY